VVPKYAQCLTANSARQRSVASIPDEICCI
jgi:hypothetical protein